LIPYRKALGLQIAPQEGFVPSNVTLGHRPAVVRPNSGEPAAGTGRARAEGGPGVSYAWFGDLVEAEVLPVMTLSGSRRRAASQACLRRGGATAAAKGEQRASVGARGGVGVVGRLWRRTPKGVRRRRP
jgi:hypothetical protein